MWADRTGGDLIQIIPPGGEYLMLIVAAAHSIDKANETLEELSGVKLPSSTFHRKVTALGKEIIEFKEKELAEGQLQADVLYIGVDGDGVDDRSLQLQGNQQQGEISGTNANLGRTCWGTLTKS